MNFIKSKAFASKSPALILLIVALSVFISETLVMLLLHYLPQESILGEAFVDAMLLTAFLTPILYFVLFLPMSAHIHERQRVEDVLLKNKEEQFKAMIRTSLDGFWVTDMRGRFMEVNDSYCQMVGYSREELLNMGIVDVEAIATAEGAALHIGELIEKGNLRFETRHRHKNGSILDIEVSANYSKSHGEQIYCFLRDITERKQTEEERKLSAQLLNSTSDTIFLLDLEGRFVYLNDAAWKSRGYTRDEMMAMNLRDLNAPEYNEILSLRIKDLLEKGQGFFESAHRRKDGSIMPVEISTRIIESGGRKLLLSVIRDVTERKQKEQELRKFKAIIESSDDAIITKSLNGVIESWNHGAEEIFGYKANEAIGSSMRVLIPPDRLKEEQEILARISRGERVDHFETVRLRKNGQLVDISATLSPILDDEGKVIGASKIARDITLRKTTERQIQHMANYDLLTDLPNRTLLSDRMQQAQAIAKRDKAHLALVFIDLDKFKPINDGFGHHVGDLMLKEVAKRMQDCVRESDTVSRIGGDEFVVLLPVIEATQDAILVAEKIRHAINQPFALAGQNLSISSSIGIAVYPEHGKDVMLLVKNADTAMYQAKEGGRNKVRLYQPDMQGDPMNGNAQITSSQ